MNRRLRPNHHIARFRDRVMDVLGEDVRAVLAAGVTKPTNSLRIGARGRGGLEQRLDRPVNFLRLSRPQTHHREVRLFDV